MKGYRRKTKILANGLCEIECPHCGALQHLTPKPWGFECIMCEFVWDEEDVLEENTSSYWI